MYGLRLSQCLDWSPAELLALVEGLPPGSRTQASAHGDAYLGYGRTEAMLADLWDLQVRVAAGKKWKASMVYPRPSSNKNKGARSLASFIPGR